MSPQYAEAYRSRACRKQGTSTSQPKEALAPITICVLCIAAHHRAWSDSSVQRRYPRDICPMTVDPRFTCMGQEYLVAHLDGGASHALESSSCPLLDCLFVVAPSQNRKRVLSNPLAPS